ncbi:TPA: hypothetical protein U2I12_000722 [Citrobacter farmeri]|nr:hypothetical protein [Citrobacter farmeri]
MKNNISHRQKMRDSRKKSGWRLSTDAEKIQEEMMDKGYRSVIEILLTATNDAADDLEMIAKQHGVTSTAYQAAFQNLKEIARTSSPFFVKEKPKKIVIKRDVESELMDILNRKGTDGDDDESTLA